jgi:hypothetical protein
MWGQRLVRLTIVGAVLLGVTACGGGSGSDSPRRTATPAVASPTPGGSAVPPGPPRTLRAVLGDIRGRAIEADGRTVRVDPRTVVCGGVGRPSGRRHGRPAWTRFRCIQPTFPAGSVAGPDLIFTVRSVPPGDFVVTDRHFTSY